jgi:hypothetical protein
MSSGMSKTKKGKQGLKLNGTHQLLVYTNVNLVGKSKYYKEMHRRSVSTAKYMLISHCKSAGQNHELLNPSKM